MTYGYTRVSTDHQTVENQRFEVSQFCAHNGFHIDEWTEETISGTKPVSKRQLGRLLDKMKADDLIICCELSRLGRTLFMIMDVLSECMKRGVKLWTTKEGYRLGDDIQSKVLAFSFGLSAEIERNLISQRTKEALHRLVAEGKYIGRKQGRLNNCLNAVCIANHALICENSDSGVSVPKIAKSIGVSLRICFPFKHFLCAF